MRPVLKRFPEPSNTAIDTSRRGSGKTPPRCSGPLEISLFRDPLHLANTKGKSLTYNIMTSLIENYAKSDRAVIDHRLEGIGTWTQEVAVYVPTAEQMADHAKRLADMRWRAEAAKGN
jgi:hypothetical protein